MMQIEVGFPGGKRVDASFDGFVVRTDQPAPFGEGTAPTPFELFLASLATCAGIYVLSFFQQRDLPVDGLKLVQRVDRDPHTGMLSLIAMEIMLPVGFPEKYRDAVVRAAEQCAVKKNLENPPRFSVVAVGASSGVGEGTPSGV